MRLTFFCAAASVLLGIQDVHAQTTYTWNGGTGSWQTATHWSPNGVPALSSCGAPPVFRRMILLATFSGFVSIEVINNNTNQGGKK